MTSIQINSKVDASGVLNLSIPLGPLEANKDVKVTVEPIGDAARPMTPEQWRKFVADMEGCVTDSTFERPPQGELETRDELFP